MNGDEFDAYTRDKTFYFAESGQPYGAEEIPAQPPRKMVLSGWTLQGREVVRGSRAKSALFTKTGPILNAGASSTNLAGLIARFEGVTGGTILYETRQSEQPMMCMGPDVGV